MENFQPNIIENREFVEYEEEDIQRLNKVEASKFAKNPEIEIKMREIESELNLSGNWEEHWLTVDPSGRRMYARIYYTNNQALALTADGEIIREISFPNETE